MTKSKRHGLLIAASMIAAAFAIGCQNEGHGPTSKGDDPGYSFVSELAKGDSTTISVGGGSIGLYTIPVIPSGAVYKISAIRKEGELSTELYLFRSLTDIENEAPLEPIHTDIVREDADPGYELSAPVIENHLVIANDDAEDHGPSSRVYILVRGADGVAGKIRLSVKASLRDGSDAAVDSIYDFGDAVRGTWHNEWDAASIVEIDTASLTAQQQHAMDSARIDLIENYDFSDELEAALENRELRSVTNDAGVLIGYAVTMLWVPECDGVECLGVGEVVLTTVEGDAAESWRVE